MAHWRFCLCRCVTNDYHLIQRVVNDNHLYWWLFILKTIDNPIEIEYWQYCTNGTIQYPSVGSWPKTPHRTDICGLRGESEGLSRQAFRSLERLICALWPHTWYISLDLVVSSRFELVDQRFLCRSAKQKSDTRSRFVQFGADQRFWQSARAFPSINDTIYANEQWSAHDFRFSLPQISYLCNSRVLSHLQTYLWHGGALRPIHTSPAPARGHSTMEFSKSIWFWFSPAAARGRGRSMTWPLLTRTRLTKLLQHITVLVYESRTSGKQNCAHIESHCYLL